MQTLVGLEESVNSWLPSDATGAPASSQISSKQLAELIRDAPKLTPLKTKVAALVEPEHCAHVEERLTAASNQYQTWAICWDCHSRWKLPMEWHRTASPKKPRAKASASSSAAEAFKKEIQGRMEAEMRAEFAHKVQEQALNSQSMMLQLRSTHAEVDQMRERLSNQAMANLEEMGQLQCAIEEDTRMKAQLSQMRWNQEVQQVMMNEYATMAMGQEVPRSSRLPPQRDAHVCRKNFTCGGGDSEGVQDCGSLAHGESGGGIGSEQQNGEEATEQVSDKVESGIPTQEVWVKLTGDGMAERVEEFSRCPHFGIQDVFVKDGNEAFAIADVEELVFEDECFVVLRQSVKDAAEDWLPEVEETALPRKTKKQLRRALNDGVVNQAFAVEVSEESSTPRGWLKFPTMEFLVQHALSRSAQTMAYRERLPSSRVLKMHSLSRSARFIARREWRLWHKDANSKLGSRMTS